MAMQSMHFTLPVKSCFNVKWYSAVLTLTLFPQFNVEKRQVLVGSCC